MLMSDADLIAAIDTQTFAILPFGRRIAAMLNYMTAEML